MKRRKYSCFAFGEGGNDKKFIIALIELDKFKYHTKKWVFNYGNASGQCAEEILKRCRGEISKINYDLVLCFIDLDDLKNDYPNTWENKRSAIEKEYSGIEIIWQVENAEDEYKKVLRLQYGSKGKINKLARKNIQTFINSDFYKKYLPSYKTNRKNWKIKK